MSVAWRGMRGVISVHRESSGVLKKTKYHPYSNGEVKLMLPLLFVDTDSVIGDTTGEVLQPGGDVNWSCFI